MISLVLKNKSIDLYCEDEKVNNWFYGLKYFTKYNHIEYKIFSTNKFVINKIKYKIITKLKIEVENEKIKEEKVKVIVNKLIEEKADHKISFAKLMILYDKLNNL